jgi:hypothetical protein
MPSEAVQQLLEQGQRSGLFSSAEAHALIAQMSADEVLSTDFEAQEADLAFILANSGRATGAGSPKMLLDQWQIDHNWPDHSGRVTALLFPKVEGDQKLQRIDLLSRDPASAHYLKPRSTSPLATGGAGGDLPSYVGAVPPEGVEPWDWDKTWEARNLGQKASKTGKD